MPDEAAPAFSVSRVSHRALGTLVQLQFGPEFVLRLTPSEASSLSFAFVAVRDGISPEREIYISPVASDASFTGLVDENGISVITPDGALKLDWAETGKLAAAIAEAV